MSINDTLPSMMLPFIGCTLDRPSQKRNNQSLTPKDNANSCRKNPDQDLNLGPSCCKATGLPAAAQTLAGALDAS